MKCPKCRSNNFVLGGKYAIKRTKIRIQRFRCKDCGHNFVRRTRMYRAKISFKIRDEIIKMYRTKKPYKNKFDVLKKKTYSTREIARRLNVSKSFVHSVVKKDEKRKRDIQYSNRN